MLSAVKVVGLVIGLSTSTYTSSVGNIQPQENEKGYVTVTTDEQKERQIKEVLEEKAELLKKREQERKEQEEAERLRQEEEKKKQQLETYGVYEGQTFSMEATAYTPFCKGCIGITKTGIDVRDWSKETYKIIAVDPTVIPLKTKVELIIEGISYGVYSCEDTGGAIKNNRIDVLYRTTKEAKNFGRKYDVQVKVVEFN